MATPSRPPSQSKYSLQYMENSSLDEDFGVLTREMLTYNPVAGTLEKATVVGQGNFSLAFTYDGDGNLETIAKTVGATTYTKTLGYTGSRLTSITVWV